MSKKLLAILFLILFGVAHYFLSAAYVNKVLQDTSFVKVDNKALPRISSDRMLIVGDSHFVRGIDDSLGNAVKWATVGESYVQNYYKLEFLINEKGITPKTVVLPADLHSFSGFRAERTQNDAFWVRYADYLEMGIKLNAFFPFIGKYVKGTYFPYVGEGPAFVEWSLTKKNTPERKPKAQKQNKRTEPNQDPDNSEPELDFDSARMELAEKRVKTHFLDASPYDERLTYYFRQLLDLCRSHNIHVVLIRMPVTKEYLKAANSYINKAEHELFVKSLILNRPDIEYHDFLELYFDQGSYYYDSDHLNSQGAQAFTEHLMNLGILE